MAWRELFSLCHNTGTCRNLVKLETGDRWKKVLHAAHCETRELIPMMTTKLESFKRILEKFMEEKITDDNQP